MGSANGLRARLATGANRIGRPLGLVAKLQLAWQILIGYLRARRQLRRFPLPTVLAVERAVPATQRPMSHPAGAFRIAWAVERVLGRVPGDVRCLVRSVALVGLLARRGVSSTLVIGVRAHGEFAAHAWVEVGGRPLLPTGLHYERLTEL